MKFLYLYIFSAIFVLNFFNGQAQTCQKNKINDYLVKSALQVVQTQASNTRSDTVDILKYTINLNITDFTTNSIRGNTIVKFTPKINGVTKLNLDLLVMIIDSVKQNSTILTYTYNDTLLQVNLPATYN